MHINKIFLATFCTTTNNSFLISGIKFILLIVSCIFFFHIFRHFDYLLPVNKTLAFFFNSIQSSFIYFIWLLYLQHRKDVTVTFQFNEVSTQGYIDQKPMHGNCMNYRFVDGDEEAILTCKELKELVFCEFYGFIYNIHTFSG